MIKTIPKSFLLTLLFLLFALPAFCQLPFPQWVDDFGGSGDSKPTGMVIDKQNNIYITGYFSGTVDFDPSSGVKNLTSVGGYDIYVGKYKADGTLIWAESMGGDDLDQANCMSVDASGNITIAGQFASTNLNANPQGSDILSSQGADDIFIIHLDTNGNFLWATSIGGSQEDRGDEVANDSQGNILVSSIFESQITLGSSTYTPQGYFDGLITKYSPTGVLLWSINIGSSGDSGAMGIRVDSNNNVAVSGVYSAQTNFNPLGIANNQTASIGDSPYVAEYNSSGILLWFAGISGNVVNTQSVVSIDTQNNVYFTAANTTDLLFNNGNTNVNLNGTAGLVIAKYSSTGAFQFVKSMSGANASGYVYQIVNDQSNNIYIAGYLTGTINFNPAGTPADNVSDHGQRDFFLAKYDSNGNYDYAFSGGSPNCNLTLGIELAVDYNNKVDLAGSFCSTVNFNPSTCGADNVTAINSTSDSFIAQYAGTAATSTLTNNVITAPDTTIFCGSGRPSAITGAIPTGGDGAYVYQWQSSPDSVTFTNIAGATGQNYSPPLLTTTTYYRRVVTDGSCVAASNSNVITIKIQSAATNNTITAPAVTTFCGTGTPAAITGSLPTGGNGTYDYQWQSSIDDATFTSLSGDTAQNLTPVPLTVTTYFRRSVKSGNCILPSYSNTIAITVQPVISSNVVTGPADSSFCNAGNPGTITGSVPGGGTGSYTYQWQSSADSITFVNITTTDAEAQNYTPPALTQTTYYRRVVTSGTCSQLVSNTVGIHIYPQPATPVPVNPVVTICQGAETTLAVSSPQAGITYNWYNSQSGSDLLFTGSTFITGAINTDSTFYVQAVNKTCTSPSFASVKVNITSAPPAPQVVNSSATVCSGTTATFAIAGQQSGYSYNWYTVATGGESIFIGTAFTTPPLSGSTIYYAEAENSTGCFSATRTPVNVVVIPLASVSAQAVTICAGTAATLTATSADPNATITWYDASTGGTALATGSNFTTPVLNADTTFYVAAADNSSSCTPPAPTAVAVTVLQPLAVPVVVVASVTESTIKFQWTAVPGATGYQVSTDNGQTFSNPSSGETGLSTTISGLQPGQNVNVIVQALGSQSCQLSANSAPVTGTTTTAPDNLIYVPNVFTPNGDGTNDVVHVHSENINSLNFYIYDQWGELIFTSSSVQNGWDGTYKGTKEPVGVYVYYLKAVMISGQIITKKGSITLLR